VNRERKGDGERSPINPVPVAQQRAALKFVIENAFADEAFGLTPEMLRKMTVDKWEDGGNGNPGADPPGRSTTASPACRPRPSPCS
jgi:hypothetical protein